MTAADTIERPRVLVTGATGYIGARLVPRLLEAGYPVRCLVRSPRKLADRPWASDPRVEVVAVDLGESGELADAMRGCGPAFYLVHAMMSAGGDYAARDRDMARAFAQAAARAGLTRIIYLGGLGETGDGLSEHLRSRRDVEQALAGAGAGEGEGEGAGAGSDSDSDSDSGSDAEPDIDADIDAGRSDGATQGAGANASAGAAPVPVPVPVPVTTFRAAMIIGSGSASFEILRYLVERLPVMVTPRWVGTLCQPIAIRNVLQYLVAALHEPATIGRTLDIGGPDIVSYRDLMQTMAAARGLRRRIILPVPVLTPTLSALWIHLVTPLSHRIARPLAEGLRNRVVCRNDDAARLMPQRLLGVREAIVTALDLEARRRVESSWSAAGPIPGDPDWAGGALFTDERSTIVQASAAATFRAVCRVGGPYGWHRGHWLWRLRGAIDRLAGGPGLRRGRRDPERVSFGEALDFWRVTAVERDRRLELRAEMRLPGDALLAFTIEPAGAHASDDDRHDSRRALSPAQAHASEAPESAASSSLPTSASANAFANANADAADTRGAAMSATSCRLTQTARFLPRGLGGLLYWYAVMPFHALVFDGLLRGIAAAAESMPAPEPPRD